MHVGMLGFQLVFSPAHARTNCMTLSVVEDREQCLAAAGKRGTSQSISDSVRKPPYET
jgi:hypothetical protein